MTLLLYKNCLVQNLQRTNLEFSRQNFTLLAVILLNIVVRDFIAITWCATRWTEIFITHDNVSFWDIWDREAELPFTNVGALHRYLEVGYLEFCRPGYFPCFYSLKLLTVSNWFSCSLRVRDWGVQLYFINTALYWHETYAQRLIEETCVSHFW